MKHNFLKLYISCFFILSNVVMFAQGDDDDDGDLEGNDPPPVPINPKLIYLLIVGVIFAFYHFRKVRKTV